MSNSDIFLPIGQNAHTTIFKNIFIKGIAMNRIVLITSTLLITCLSSLFAFQEKPGNHAALELIPDKIQPSKVVGNLRIEIASGIPRAVYSPDYPVSPADPETMARQYLSENRQFLRHRKDPQTLKFAGTTETPGGYRILFTQQLNNIPVYGGRVKISLNRKNQVVFVMNGYQQLGEPKNEIRLSPTSALDIAQNYLGLHQQLLKDTVETMIYSGSGLNAIYVYRIGIVPGGSEFGDWEVLVNAESGEIVRVEDKACYFDELRETGSGWVFDPDPITDARTYYGQPQFSDNGDQDSDSLTAHLKEVALENISPYGSSDYYLSGPYASIVDFESPYNGYFEQGSTVFHFTRSADAFEAVNCYYHINKAMSYLNDSLGFQVMPNQYTGGVRFDPRGLDGAANAYYSPYNGWVAFGAPGGAVDAAEDPIIIWHELAHGIHDWISLNGISQYEGLSEGTSDYWAQSHSRSFGRFTPNDPQYNYFGLWGLQPYGSPYLRVTNYQGHYPENLFGEVHYDGMLWSSSLMTIYDAIGREATDIDCWEAMSMTDQLAGQVDAAFAFIQADRDRYEGAHLNEIVPVFTQRGYLSGPVMARFEADVTGGPGSLTVNFTDKSFAYPDPATSWQWDFENDGIIDATVQNPSHTFTGPGLYSVVLIVSNGTESDTLVEQDMISINSGVLVYDGQPNGTDYSGVFISDELDDLGIECRYGTPNHLWSSLIGYDAVFLSLGNIGMFGLSASRIDDATVATINEYLAAGGKLYVEGGTFLGSVIFMAIDGGQTIWNYFGINGVEVWGDAHPLSTLAGRPNSIMADIIFNSSTQINNYYLDRLNWMDGGTISFNDESYGNVAVENSGSNGYRTFYTGYALSKLVDEDSPNTRTDVLLRLAEFFNLHGLRARFEPAFHTGNAPLSVTFTDQSYSNPSIQSWQWDFDNDGVIDSEEQNPSWTYDAPGIYSVRLTVTNANTSQSVLMENTIEVFAGETALRFSENNNYLICPASSSLNLVDAMTIEAWIHPTGWGNNNSGEGRLIDNGWIRLFLNKSGSTLNADSSLSLQIKHADGTLSKMSTSANSIRLNQWQHIAVTYDGASSEVHLFVNGIDQTEIAVSPTGPIKDQTGRDMYIGNNNTQSKGFEGRIDEMSIWNVAIPADSIVFGISNYLNGDETGLVAYWPMNEGNGDSLLDHTANANNAAIFNASWTEGTDFITAVVNDGDSNLPIDHLILSNYPNPFNPTTTIIYSLPEAADVHLSIYDLGGRLVSTLARGYHPGGKYQIQWNGADAEGRLVPTGIYLARIEAGHSAKTIKMVYLK